LSLLAGACRTTASFRADALAMGLLNECSFIA
jgi:hypothetical protein